MSFILSCVILLTAILFIYLSCQTRDKVVAQVNKILGISIFLVSFLFSPFLFKLIMLLALIIVWPYLVERLSLSFYRQLNK
jgi:hypothetical protein